MSDAIVLYKFDENYYAFDEDAEAVSRVCDLPLAMTKGIPRTDVTYWLFAKCTRQLVIAGYQIAVVQEFQTPSGQSRWILRKVSLRKHVSA